MYISVDELHRALVGVLSIDADGVHIIDEKMLRASVIDALAFTAVFAPEADLGARSRSLIRRAANALGIRCASLHTYYLAVGRGEAPTTATVPAINVRTLTYDVARTIFKVQMAQRIGPIIFELARSEMGYTDQTPEEYAAVVLAAAIKEGYRGPAFVQGDHFQVNAPRYTDDPAAELDSLKHLITEAIAAGFYNIDLDASTLVDLAAPTLDGEQAENYRVSAMLTEYIRSHEPAGTTISVGAEIGHIGGRNSTPEDLTAFMGGYEHMRDGWGAGISKVSVQTGTSHGGVPLPDGRIAQVRLDLSVIDKLGRVVREEYHLGGVVQHGASTLPRGLFGEFPKHKTLEIHLATEFQNIVFDQMPESLRQDMYHWVHTNCLDEWQANGNQEQFQYRSRKKAFGPFKRQLWGLSAHEKAPIMEALEQQFRFLFERLNVVNTSGVLIEHLE
jgi:fructose-bisphosphate aldolase, class II